MSHTDHSKRASAPRSEREVSPELRRQIDENLRRLYRRSAEEALPEHLQALVARLRDRDGAP
ncbi:NepR family anti-sigma factor [Rhodobaculum claviforme]|uniref:Anti-sigma factor NepR domain-containing protein n=1 Tax=Rhodobaculum claviforme TaxID=1549854 RepID=A0A934TKF3_9RHOB|nr:NepR family anti-sigma factor [Rhodobaculum claviforme]MBK5927785.1 hypothetical protein [Rhodobaculum claviforme]